MTEQDSSILRYHHDSRMTTDKPHQKNKLMQGSVLDDLDEDFLWQIYFIWILNK